MLKLDRNEAPEDLPLETKQRWLDEIVRLDWHRYPSIDAKPLRSFLSALHKWPEEGIVVGNGSDEVLQAIFIGLSHLFDSVVIPSPTFGMYKVLAKRFGKHVVEISAVGDLFEPDLKRITEAVSDERTLVFICQPNNPTGLLWTDEQLELIHGSARGLIVIDQAYGEFCERQPACMPFGKRTIVLRTLSKALAGAGLRVGFGFASTDVAPELQKGFLPYGLNILTQQLAMKYLALDELARERVRLVVDERKRLLQLLSQIDGVTPLASEGNFILFRVADAWMVAGSLASRKIAVRHYVEPELSEYLRVTVGRPTDNDAFLRALREVLGGAQTLG